MNKYNKFGCLDMTAYLALRNIERDEARTNRASKDPVKYPKSKHEAARGHSPMTGQKL